jgi:hypothetical protein
MGEKRIVYSILVRRSERKRPFTNLAVDGRIILEWILGKLFGGLWNGCIWLKRVAKCGVL